MVDDWPEEYHAKTLQRGGPHTVRFDPDQPDGFDDDGALHITVDRRHWVYEGVNIDRLKEWMRRDGLPPDTGIDYAPDELIEKARLWERRQHEQWQAMAYAPAPYFEPVEPPVKPYSEIKIDTRALIRESRAYEATTGPPPRRGNENGPGVLENSTGPNSLCDPEKNCTANVIRIAENSKSRFGEGITAPENPSAGTAMRDLNPEGVADDDQHKTRH